MTPQDPPPYGNQPPYQPGSQEGYPYYQSGSQDPYSSYSSGPQDGYPSYQPKPQEGYPPYQPGPGMPGTYPSQQPYYPPMMPPPKKKRTGLIIGLVIVGVVLVLCIGGVSAFAFFARSVASTASNVTVPSYSNPTSSSSSSSSSSNSSSPGHHKVGDTVTLDSTWQISVDSVKTSAGDEFDKPGSGKEYLLVKVTAKNISGKSQTFSSLLQCTLRDAGGTQINETFTALGTPPDGNVQSGDKISGTLVYAVPLSHNGMTFQVLGSLEGTAATYDL